MTKTKTDDNYWKTQAALAEQEAQILREAMQKIKILTGWPANKTDHRLPVVADANKIAVKALEQSNRNKEDAA